MTNTELSEQEFERHVQHARQRLCGDDPLEEWESRLQEDVNEWATIHRHRLSDDEWKAVAHMEHPDDTMVIRYMTGDLFIRGLKETAMAVAELRECAREIVDGVFAGTDD